jgi:hypothetical protein
MVSNNRLYLDRREVAKEVLVTRWWTNSTLRKKYASLFVQYSHRHYVSLISHGFWFVTNRKAEGDKYILKIVKERSKCRLIIHFDYLALLFCANVYTLLTVYSNYLSERKMQYCTVEIESKKDSSKLIHPTKCCPFNLNVCLFCSLFTILCPTRRATKVTVHWSP